ncbi:MAG: GntR family transcriptional regulator [Acidimicrobiia bacterium]|nr:GntR family transcriptional regulator [Acidimicrobiia bacterium]
MLVKVDACSTEPIFRQVAAQVRAAVATGEVEPGDRLPPARELAGALGVNMHTVLRAYALLRDEGLVEMRRRRGVIVQGGAPARARLLGLATDLTAEARRQGMDLVATYRLLEEAWS